MEFHGPVYGVTPNLKGQRIVIPSTSSEESPRYHQQSSETEQERAAFEQWYLLNSSHYEAAPIGSHDCDLQWQAWLARAQREEIAVC